MKRLNEGVLKVGDIILTTTTAAVSKAIRAGTRSDISHGMIYVDNCSVIDATAEGVQARNTQRLIFEDDCSIYTMRARDGLTKEQVNSICLFVRAVIGTQYSVREAIQAGLGGSHEWSKKQFCSRLVAQAYASAGVTLVDDSNFCSPADIKASPALIEVRGATVPVTAEEAARWEGRQDTTQMMRGAINAVLEGARKKNKNIQSFEDLNDHLIEHPEDDAYFCDLLGKSGYLTLGNVETQKCPWQYDVGLMKEFACTSADVEKYCWSVLSEQQAGPNRYIVNRGGYLHLSQQTRLRTFHILAELYELLATLHRRRLEVATEWLSVNGLLEIDEEPFLRPHTPEWFAALEVWDPRKAMMTRSAVEAAGSLNVCSVCADSPAGDYRLQEGHRPPSAVDTLRLCDDCLVIRKRAGEPFVALVGAMPEM